MEHISPYLPHVAATARVLRRHLHLGDGHMWPFIAIMITCKCKSESEREGEKGRERGGEQGEPTAGLHLAKPLAACPTMDAAVATCIRSALVAQLIMLIIFISGQPKKRQQQQQQRETIAALTICHADGLRDGQVYRCRRSLRSKNRIENQTQSRKGPQKIKATKPIWLKSSRRESQLLQS